MTRGVKYVSLHETSGYGRAARPFILGLDQAGVPVTWVPMVPGRALGLGYQPQERRAPGDPLLDPLWNRPLRYETVILHTVPEYLPFWREREPNKRILLHTVWETDRLPRHWPDLLNQADGLIVPCHWNRRVFREGGVSVPISVIPHILTDLPEVAARSEHNASVFVFYTIGEWTERKAIAELVRCYLDEFSADESVCLVIKTSRWDQTLPRRALFRRSSAKALRRLLRPYGSPARIRLIAEQIDEPQLAALHQTGDCYVSLCHSEGWGLGAFEAAGAGRAVIMTGYGGHRDYLAPDTAYLVDYRLTPVRVRRGRRSYSRDQRWAIADPAHARRLMRRVFEQREEARTRAVRLEGFVRQNFNQDTVIPLLIEVLQSASPCAL